MKLYLTYIKKKNSCIIVIFEEHQGGIGRWSCLVGKSIWKVKVPTKVAFFAWIAALGNILTIDNL